MPAMAQTRASCVRISSLRRDVGCGVPAPLPGLKHSSSFPSLPLLPDPFLPPPQWRLLAPASAGFRVAASDQHRPSCQRCGPPYWYNLPYGAFTTACVPIPLSVAGTGLSGGIIKALGLGKKRLLPRLGLQCPYPTTLSLESA